MYLIDFMVLEHVFSKVQFEVVYLPNDIIITSHFLCGLECKGKVALSVGRLVF